MATSFNALNAIAGTLQGAQKNIEERRTRKAKKDDQAREEKIIKEARAAKKRADQLQRDARKAELKRRRDFEKTQAETLAAATKERTDADRKVQKAIAEENAALRRQIAEFGSFSDKAQKQISLLGFGETVRSNKVNEGLRLGQLSETRRSNKSRESLEQERIINSLFGANADRALRRDLGEAGIDLDKLRLDQLRLNSNRSFQLETDKFFEEQKQALTNNQFRSLELEEKIAANRAAEENAATQLLIQGSLADANIGNIEASTAKLSAATKNMVQNQTLVQHTFTDRNGQQRTVPITFEDVRNLDLNEIIRAAEGEEEVFIPGIDFPIPKEKAVDIMEKREQFNDTLRSNLRSHILDLQAQGRTALLSDQLDSERAQNFSNAIQALPDEERDFLLSILPPGTLPEPPAPPATGTAGGPLGNAFTPDIVGAQAEQEAAGASGGNLMMQQLLRSLTGRQPIR
jgi:hypothetical protein